MGVGTKRLDHATAADLRRRVERHSLAAAVHVCNPGSATAHLAFGIVHVLPAAPTVWNSVLDNTITTGLDIRVDFLAVATLVDIANNVSTTAADLRTLVVSHLLATLRIRARATLQNAFATNLCQHVGERLTTAAQLVIEKEYSSTAARMSVGVIRTLSTTFSIARLVLKDAVATDFSIRVHWFTVTAKFARIYNNFPSTANLTF